MSAFNYRGTKSNDDMDKRDKKIIELFRSGYEELGIAERYGISLSRVRQIVRKYGLRTRQDAE